MSNRPALLFALALSLLCATTSGQTTYTYPDLVRRMTDLRLLATLPPAGEKTLLASSYDRRSRYDAAADKYIDWAANDDGSGVERKEGTDSVMMDVQGPGCIWRTWSATAGPGHVKIYLDGAAEPAVDLPFAAYFDGKTAPFNRPNIVYIPSKAARGFDNYTPIPFEKSCKIVGEKGWGNYYHFNYTRFAAGTVVPTFAMKMPPADSAALDEADAVLGRCGTVPPIGGTDVNLSSLRVGPGKTAKVLELPGTGAVTLIRVKLALPADPEAERNLLRQLTISIRWDGETAPAVWSPLGDFFGYVGGADRFKSLPVGVVDKPGDPAGTATFYCNWYMPFANGAQIEVGNDGPAAVAMDWETRHEIPAAPVSSLARFHAKWHRDAFLPARADRAPDWTLLTTQGTGRFVGTHVHGWNPRGQWWGEGDEKFFIDGEKFPSTFGTGSEDYFGYAWSSTGHFSRPYHNQILNENNAGHFDDNRWHVSDSVPFGTSFEADIEKYFSNDRPTLYAAEVYWYLNAGGVDPYQPVPVTDRVGYWIRPPVYRASDAIEGESLQVIGKPEHRARAQQMQDFGNGWSGESQLFWTPARTGETLELRLPPQKAGKYQLIARYTLAPDYGIFQVNFNGTDIGKPIDLYGPAVKANAEIDLGVVTLPDGEPTFKLTVTGKNAASRGYYFGLDYLKLVPAR
jgi:hypothetical protein